MLFHADEHIDHREAQEFLGARGHVVVRVRIGAKDPTVLTTADRNHAILLTADKWIYTQLRRLDHVHSIYRHAGVIRVPGEWPEAATRLRYWLPLIEAAYDLMQDQRDKRLVVEIRSSTILIDA
jgi:hypothetical protein